MSSFYRFFVLLLSALVMFSLFNQASAAPAPDYGSNHAGPKQIGSSHLGPEQQQTGISHLGPRQQEPESSHLGPRQQTGTSHLGPGSNSGYSGPVGISNYGR
ncbi:unnamed protein product [Ceutorhynchus assimilis]|uniref:Uncharacterized protein n=1 Tax=Ceutorhynchus assimilis TaxID=467358 RepID=A0A9N9QP93_9CUCU|nr:unnamed protein product [Ceutorhynchus assimilis]